MLGLLKFALVLVVLSKSCLSIVQNLMAYYEITNFSPGLDSRRSELTSKPGTLEVLNNAHINEGGEVQKRMAFVPIYLPTGTLGLQPLVNSLLVFGSGATPGGFPVSFTNLAGSQTVGYQRLTSPNTGSSAMTEVISSTLFNNAAWVAAEFADNYIYSFYGGTLDVDFTNGLVATWQGTDNQIAAAIAVMVNNTATPPNPVAGELVYTATATNNIVEVFATPSAISSSPFTTAITTVLEPTSTGQIVSNQVTNGVPAVAAVQAVGSFAILQGTALTGFATGTATVNNVVAYTGSNSVDIVNLGSNTYFFATSAYISAHPTDPFAVLVGANTTASALNLSKAINGTGTVGVTYTAAMSVNTQLSASPAANVLTLTALASGTAGNSVVLSQTVSTNGTYTLSGAHLSGGSNSNYISSVNVNSNNILSAQIPWDMNANQTCIDVVENINANAALNGGFTATTNGGVVTILSPVANAGTFNGQAVSVVVVGPIIVQQISFIITACTSSTTITSIAFGAPTSLTITTGTITSSGSVPLTFAGQIAANIIATGNGFTALAVAVSSTSAAVYVSPLTSSSATAIGTMTVTSGGSGGVFASGAAGALNVVLTTYSVAGATLVSSTVRNTNFNTSTTKSQYLTASVGCQASGGVAPYNYKWTFAGTGTSQLVCQHSTSQTTGWFYTTITSSQGPSTPSNQSEQWICTVTDSAGVPNVQSSQALIILF